MAVNENLIPIPGRLHSVATEEHVAGANEIYDDDMNMLQSAINADLKNGTLYPVDVEALTPQSTFVRNAIIGINGVIYKAKVDTSNLPITLVVDSGAFVAHIINGKKAFEVSSYTLNSDWEIWTDAAIEYWLDLLAQRASTLENSMSTAQSNISSLQSSVSSLQTNVAGKQDIISDLTTIRSGAVDGSTAIQPDTTYGGYTVASLLIAMSNLMDKSVVAES